MGMDLSQYMDTYLEESADQLQRLNELLLDLEKSPAELSILNEVFRVAHTLKGMSATMGFNNIAELTHQMENVLDALRNGSISVTSDILDILFDCLDMLEVLTNEVREKGKDEASVEDVVGKLKAILSGEEEIGKSEAVHEVSETEDASLTSTTGEVDIEFDEHDIAVIKEALQRNYNVYKIKVVLDEKTMLKSARSYMVFRDLGLLGDIIKSVPPAKDIEEEKFGFEFSLVLITKEKKDEVKNVVSSIAEIKEVIVESVSLPDTGEEIEAPEEKIVKQKEITTQAPRKDMEKPKASKVDKTKLLMSKLKGTHTIRVDIKRVDALMNLVGELVINKTRLAQIGTTYRIAELDETLTQIGRITSDLQSVVMKIRMVPVEQVFDKFPRMVRDLARDEGKEVEFIIEGKDTELDRTVIDEIGDPLVHLLRNSIDHGIETPEEREAVGKNRKGRLYLGARHEGNHVVIEVEDDGRGISVEKVKQKAIERGIITEEDAERMSKDEIIELVTLPGFSTADQVSEVSGRGVGMDVVRTTVESLNGSMELYTEEGKGTRVVIKLPLTLAIIQALLTSVGGEIYAIPLESIDETLSVVKSDIKTVQNREVIVLRGNILPLIWLHEKLDIAEGNYRDRDEYAIVVVKGKGRRAGLVVDNLIGQQEIVIKSLGYFLRGIKGIAGANILGDGTVALILDVMAFL